MINHKNNKTKKTKNSGKKVNHPLVILYPQNMKTTYVMTLYFYDLQQMKRKIFYKRTKILIRKINFILIYKIQMNKMIMTMNKNN